MKIGPVMIDLEGLELNAEEKDLLQHPLVGGIIFFARNFESPEQIQALSESIRAHSKNTILTCVDQEGGRVQRFKKGFTRLPPLRPLGEIYDRDPKHALELSRKLGWLMASEVVAVDVDFSFAPVLDLDYGVSEVIGDRAFHSDESIVEELALAYVSGMASAGMACVGKHFPGHGFVVADSHLELPTDNRELTEIMQKDIKPFAGLTSKGVLHGIMPAHVVYEKFDSPPAGFSSKWLKGVLRNQLKFDGAIFSDDLNMEAAGVAGSFTDRAYEALDAGCDMVLVCNNRGGAVEVLDNVDFKISSDSTNRLGALVKQKSLSRATLTGSEEWQGVVEQVRQNFGELS